MQALMVRLAEAARLMPCLPSVGQSMATTRQVLAAIQGLSPPLGDDAIVQYLRAALQYVLGQALAEQGQGDTIETAEELWGAAGARGLRVRVMARLKLPASVPARVWLERRRLEGELWEAGADGGGDCGASDCGSSCGSSCSGDGSPRGPRSRASGGSSGGGGGSRGRRAGVSALQRWLASLLRAGRGGDGCGGGELPQDPPFSHVLECLEGSHGVAAMEGAKAMIAAAARARPGSSGGSGGCGWDGASGGGCGGGLWGDSWLALHMTSALLTSSAATADAAALGGAIVAAADGDAERLERLRAEDADRQQWWQQQEWQRQTWAPRRGGGAPRGPAAARGNLSASGGAPAPALGGAAFPAPGDAAYDKMLIAAAKHGRTGVLRTLLEPLRALPPPQLQTRGALILGIALERRQLDMVWFLVELGLTGNARDGHRLLQEREPPAPPPAAHAGSGHGAGAAGASGAGEEEESEGDVPSEELCCAADLLLEGPHPFRRVTLKPAAPPPRPWACGACAPIPEAAGVAAEEAAAAAAAAAEASAAAAASVEADVAAALALLASEPAGGRRRDERLLHNWLATGADGRDASSGGRPLCAARCAALLRAVAAADPLPPGARRASPRTLLARGVLPAGDPSLLQAAFDWLDRADVVKE
jgi:hypothetical protein